MAFVGHIASHFSQVVQLLATIEYVTPGMVMALGVHTVTQARQLLHFEVLMEYAASPFRTMDEYWQTLTHSPQAVHKLSTTVNLL
jgi:ABC-type bacteriocin/lantibiotic exporter with double-glycine peptidase domain